jgi:uncharacterized repeat protein (TIGR01451 family)
VTNTGNVELTGLTLTDSLFDLVAKGCTIPTSLGVGKDFHCDYTDTATVGTKHNVATVDTNQTEPEDDDASVTVGTGSLKVTKIVSPAAPEGFTGSFGIRISCTDMDPINTTIEFPDPGFITVDDIPAGSVCVVIETSRSDPPDGFDWAGSIISDPVTIVADQTAGAEITNILVQQQAAPTLGVIKTNSAPIIGGVHTAKEGTSVTYTLTYTVTGDITNGVLTDVLPAGVTYTAGTASSDSTFTFVDFNVTTPGALTWKAATATDGTGTLTYQVTINKGAAALTQPLTNHATIDSEETTPVTVTSNVFVPPPPLADTAPPTDIAGTSGDANVSGGSMLFILLALAGLVLTIAFVAPTPASLRKRR